MTSSALGTSVGKKTVMAVTGLILFGFVIVHMLGNLQIFLGREALNSYAEHLEELGPLLWVARAVLLAALIAHVYTAARLTYENSQARPIGYAHKDTVQASYASRTMMMSGVIVFLFIVYHLLHFTFCVTQPGFKNLLDAGGDRDVYAMVILGFQSVPVSVVYVLAMLALAFHLSHGVQSLFQTLGFNHPNATPFIRTASVGFGLLVLFGNSSIPLAVLSGVLRAPGAP